MDFISAVSSAPVSEIARGLMAAKNGEAWNEVETDGWKAGYLHHPRVCGPCKVDRDGNVRPAERLRQALSIVRSPSWNPKPASPAAG